MAIKRILVTGAVGQIGSELTLALRERYGAGNVVAAGHRTAPSDALRESGPFEIVDVCEPSSIRETVEKYRVDTIVHMAALLSAIGEKNPRVKGRPQSPIALMSLSQISKNRLYQMEVPIGGSFL